MSMEHRKPNRSTQTLLVCHQVKNKPKFSYFSPIQIADESFPQQINEPSFNIAAQSSTVGETQIQYCHLEGEETYYDVTSMQHVAGLKFNKAIFVKMKTKNYTKNYKIIVNCIGKGAFGTVRKVQSLTSKEFRAAKCIRKNSMKEEELQKLLIEVYIMMELDHPNIANILEVYDYRNQFTLICELCEGGDLLKYLKATNKKKKNQKFIACIIKQLLRTVMYLHNMGIVHRDIKPQNILFEKADSHEVKLIDFGIATKIQPNEILTTRIGTPAYMAPEIIFEKYNEKVDVWAIGVTMYHLICGKIPFRGDGIKQIMHRIVKADIQFKDDVWQGISRECIQVIKLMTLKNHHERPSAKDIFQHPYFQKISDENLPEQEKAQFAQNIRKFQFKNKLQAAIQTFIVSQLLSIEEKNELVNFFREFDKDNDGVISTHELKTALEQRKKISAQRIDSLMGIIDTNGSGKIDYTQFLAAGFLDAKSFTTQRLKQAFSHFDTNGNGRISFEQVMAFMKQFEDSEYEVENLFNEFDINGDGSISQDQFISLMLERSTKMNISKLKQSKNQLEYVHRIDPMNLNKFCFEFVIPRGQTAIFFQNLSNSQRKSMQKVSLFKNII